MENLQKYLEWFTITISIQGRTEKTQRETINNVKNFLKYLKIKNKNITIETISLADIDEYTYFLSTRPLGKTSRYAGERKTLSARSIQIRLNSIKHFFRWTARLGFTTQINVDDIIIPKAEKPKIDFLELSELDLMYELAKLEKRADTQSRNILLLNVLYHTGARISEVAQLKVQDFENNPTNEIQIIGKWGKPRLIFINKKIRRLFLDYIEYRRNMAILGINPHKIFYSDAVFISHSDNHYWKPLTVASMSELIKNYWRKLKEMGLVNKHITAHVFRHSCATHMLRKGANIRAVQQILGHKDVKTTEGYTHVTNVDLREAMEKLEIA